MNRQKLSNIRGLLTLPAEMAAKSAEQVEATPTAPPASEDGQGAEGSGQPPVIEVPAETVMLEIMTSTGSEVAIDPEANTIEPSRRRPCSLGPGGGLAGLLSQNELG